VLRIAVWTIAVVSAAHLLTGCVVVGGARSDDSGGSSFFLVLPFAVVLLMVAVVRRWQHGGQRVGRAQSAGPDPDTANQQVLRAELSVLADDVLRLEPQVALREEARDDFEAATHRYRVAQAAMDYAKDPVDLVRVQRVVDEANWSMSRARAILDGREPPEPPAKLQRPGLRGEPAVAVDDGQRPVYVGSPAPFRAGWFSAGAGLFGGLLLGSMLGGVGGAWIVEDGDDEVGFDGADQESSDW
jgi:hypothetical protein